MSKVQFTDAEIAGLKLSLTAAERDVLNRNVAPRVTRPGPLEVFVNHQTTPVLRKLGKLPAEQDALFDLGVGTGSYPG